MQKMVIVFDAAVAANGIGYLYNKSLVEKWLGENMREKEEREK